MGTAISTPSKTDFESFELLLENDSDCDAMNWVKGQSIDSAANGEVSRTSVVIAGPSSALTIPGIVVSQIVDALSQSQPVIRIKVDDRTDFDSGLFRAPSLAAALDDGVNSNVVIREAPSNPRMRAEAFGNWITSDVRAAVAFVWPGIDSVWVRQFIAAARAAGASSTVICASVPKSNPAKLGHLADLVADADLVLVGKESDATALSSEFGISGPTIGTHQALSLDRRSGQSAVHEIMAFLPKENTDSLSTLLAAFDAIPEAWIDSYQLDVVMRYSGKTAAELVARSYHSDFVRLIGEDISSDDLQVLVASSSALIIADPAFDSRAFLTAVDCGLPIVVLASANLPDVGRGYVGALLADLNRPVSVYVALTHALRLADLQFPRPDEWNELVDRILGTPRITASDQKVLQPVQPVR
jgi:hypothetical protein